MPRDVIQVTLTEDQKLELARQAWLDFHSMCFWSFRRDIEITKSHLPLIIEGLRTYGGHKGYRVAAKLWPSAR